MPRNDQDQYVCLVCERLNDQSTRTKRFKPSESHRALGYHLKKYHTVKEQLDAGIEAWHYKKSQPETTSKCCEWLMKMGYLRREGDEELTSQFNHDTAILEEEYFHMRYPKKRLRKE